MTRFNHLRVPESWEHYWSKYPQGYTVMEALLNWVHQVGVMTDNLNGWNDYLDNFVNTFDKNLRATAIKIISEWQKDGTLEVIIDEALNTQMDVLQVEKATKNRLYKRKEIVRLPLMFRDYGDIVTATGVDYIYPQGFTIDWKTNEVFVVYSGNGLQTRHIAVFNLLTGSYKYYFEAGNWGGEGAVIRYEGNARYLYVKTKNTNLGKYNITVQPANGAVLVPIAEYDVGLHYNFDYRNGEWLVEQAGADVGVRERRLSFGVYNDNFDLKRVLTIDPTDSGLFNSDYTNYFPKRQGIALADNGIVQGVGGAALKSDLTDVPYMYQGIKRYSPSGTLLEEGLMSHTKMMAVMEKNGFKCERVENEGVHVAPNGKVYSLYVYQGRHVATAMSEGLVIFEEMCDDRGAIDFSSAAISYPAYNLAKFTGRTYPRMADGKMYNLVTGAPLTTIDQICTMMINAHMGTFSFYSSAVTIKDINGVNIPSTCFVQIFNANNETFFMTWTGDPHNRRFIIYGQGARQQKEIFANGLDAINIPMGSGVTAQFPDQNSQIKAKKHSGSLVTIQGAVNIPTTRPVVLGTIPETYRPYYSQAFTVALSASSNGGYGVVYVRSSGEIELVYTSSATTFTTLNGITYHI